MVFFSIACTDKLIHGFFFHSQAVMNGYWLLLEDLDACTQDVCTVLTNLLENNYLSVPGFRDCLRITAGFQLFITLRYDQSQADGF